MSESIPRWAGMAVKHALATRRIVHVAGARQCGKTTLVEGLDLPGADRRTLDDPAVRMAAESAPAEFVARTEPGPMVIDEIQKVPDLLPAMKMKVDRDRSPGQYLVTGSTSLAANPNVRESLAGRMKTVRLRTLAQGEILRGRPGFVEGAFEGDFPKPRTGFRSTGSGPASCRITTTPDPCSIRRTGIWPVKSFWRTAPFWGSSPRKTGKPCIR